MSKVFIESYRGFDIKYSVPDELFICEMCLNPSEFSVHRNMGDVRYEVDEYIKSKRDKSSAKSIDDIKLNQNIGLIGKVVKVKFGHWNTVKERSNIIASGVVLDKCSNMGSTTYMIKLNDDLKTTKKDSNTVVDKINSCIRLEPYLCIGLNKKKGDVLLVDCNQIVEVIN